ncbi:MAG: hypothetical protein IJV33_02225 [Bacteroidaceae bacterium]|nr:hypothetical protein [Bacteroidaceae bacterium]
MRKNLYIIILLSALCACEHRPSALEQRKEEIRHNDSLELAQARKDLAIADSVCTFKAFELEDLKKQFVFEKQEKYQTKGYYVLPSYAGSKTRFSFFPEVEEGGKLLLVTIDKMRQYSFTEILLDEDDCTPQLPQGLSEAMKRDIAQCYLLAKTMQNLQTVQKQQEKQALKVKFFERKLENDEASL